MSTDSVRALSPFERWFWIADQISPANCCGRVRIHGRVTAEQVERAAAALVAEYPLLRVGVADIAGRGPRLTPLGEPRIPLRRVESDDPDAWRQEIDAELAGRFDVRKGLTRIVDVVSHAGTTDECHDFILTISHIIVDGRSLMAVLRKLVDYAAKDGLHSTETVRVPTPPGDDLIPAARRGLWRYLYSSLVDQAAALVLRPRRLTEAAPVALSDRRTRVVSRVLDAESLAALVADCRRAGVTVHGVLVAAVAQAIGGSSSAGVAGVGSPVDFRSLLEPAPDPDELGIYAPVLLGFVPFGARTSLWSSARSVNRQLERGVRQHRHLAAVAAMRFVTPKTVASGRRIAEMTNRRAPWNVSVTNLGRVEFPEHVGAWRLSGLMLAASNSCVGALTVAITTAHDEMHLAFCYVDGVMPEREAEAFADRVLAAGLGSSDVEKVVGGKTCAW